MTNQWAKAWAITCLSLLAGSAWAAEPEQLSDGQLDQVVASGDAVNLDLTVVLQDVNIVVDLENVNVAAVVQANINGSSVQIAAAKAIQDLKLSKGQLPVG